jgi:hypothetical protein
MKKILNLIACLILLSQVQVSAQTTTSKPLDNFYVDHAKNNALIYQIIYADSADNAAAIIKKLKTFLPTSNGVADFHFDSVATFTGHLKNVHIKYYGNNRELTGDFTLEVKNGKYRLVIRNMYWKSIDIVNFTNGERDLKALDDQCISDDAKNWQTFAFTILPDLNNLLIDDFKIPDNPKDSSW